MECPNCQTKNPSGARFCFNCGQALPAACANCGAGLQAGARFCNNCGHPVATAESSTPGLPPSEAAAPGISAQAALLSRYIPPELLARLQAARDSRLMQGERRIVTILFCDVTGSTLAASRLDPEEWAEIINGGFEHMIQPIYRYEGTVARLQGDGLLAFFGAPIAHEDDPERSILAGLEIIQAIDDYAVQIHQRWGIDFSVRIGINTGLVVVGEVGSDLRVEYSALGDAINLAARMEQSAQPGSVQIAAATYKLVAPLFDVEVIEDLWVKGHSEPLAAYRILGRKAAPGRLRGIVGLDAPLIGRQAEMDALQIAAGSLAQGTGQIVTLLGEAGLGKSRLVAEFSKTLATSQDHAFAWLEGRSFSYETATPYAPFIHLLRRYFGLEAGQPAAGQVQQVKHRLEEISAIPSQELSAVLATLLGLSLEGEDAARVGYLEPFVLRMQIFQSISQLIALIAQTRPVILYLDDLHWADQTSLELLQSLLPLVNQAPVMILAAFRPRPQESSWSFHEAAARDYPQQYRSLLLAPLDEGQSRLLVASLLEVEDLPAGLRQSILEKAEGNPFFLEEIIRSLLDRGLIERHAGHWLATRDIQAIEFPDTLVGVITARLDRLEDKVKNILQTAAVLGREFATPILADLLADATPLPQALIDLQQRGYIREKSPDYQQYTFKHVLTQEAAYNSILLSNRRELHRRAAESLIKRAPEAAATIAHHLVEARQTGQAVPFLVQAGESAARAYSNSEAIGFFTQALEYSEAVNDRSLLRRAYAGLGDGLTFAGRIPEALEHFQKMRRLAESAGDIQMEISALNRLASIYGPMMGQFQEADVYLDQALALSEQHQERSLFPETALIRCQMCTARADFATVAFTMAEVLKVSRENEDPWQETLALEHLASSSLYLGRYDEARQKALQGLQLARQVGNREHEAASLVVLASCDLRDGQVAAARQGLQQASEIGQLIRSNYVQTFTGWELSLVYQYEGLYEQALHNAEAALQTLLPFEAMMPFMVVPLLGILGSIYLEISPLYHEKAIDLHQHALRLLEVPGGAMASGPAWADLGFCAITAGDLELAEQTLRQGLHHPNMFQLLEKPRTLCGMANLLLARGDAPGALSQAEEAVKLANQYGMRHHLPLAYLTRGRAHLALGAPQPALDDFELCSSQVSTLGFRPLFWQSCLQSAAALTALGRPDQARTSLELAGRTIDEIAGDIRDEELRNAYLEAARHKLIVL